MCALSVIVYVGGAAAMLWAGWVALTNPRPAAARVWTGALVFSAVVLLYFATIYHWMSFVTKY